MFGLDAGGRRPRRLQAVALATECPDPAPANPTPARSLGPQKTSTSNERPRHHRHEKRGTAPPALVVVLGSKSTVTRSLHRSRVAALANEWATVGASSTHGPCTGSRIGPRRRPQRPHQESAVRPMCAAPNRMEAATSRSPAAAPLKTPPLPPREHETSTRPSAPRPHPRPRSLRARAATARAGKGPAQRHVRTPRPRQAMSHNGRSPTRRRCGRGRRRTSPPRR